MKNHSAFLFAPVSAALRHATFPFTLYSLPLTIFTYSLADHLVLEKAVFPRAGQKYPDARRATSRGMSRAFLYVAMTKGERNEAAGGFSAAR
jgi:hypothetical protein